MLWSIFMRSRDSFSEQRGFLTFAQNSADTDYLTLAYCQALSIKCSQKEVTSYAVIVDAATKALLTDKHREVFDYVIDLPEDDSANDSWKLKNEWQAWWLTPFKETMKIESDMLFSTSIDHWWAGLQQREVVLTASVRDYEGNVATSRAYRRLFDSNELPDVYNGLMYFRFGKVSREFFIYAKYIYRNWDKFKNELLKDCLNEHPTTDVVFAIAASMIGVEKCTNPALSYPTFAHMKGAMQGWGIGTDWTDKLYAQIDDELHITAGFTRQLYPFHYYQKSFITNKVVTQYETAYQKEKSNHK